MDTLFLTLLLISVTCAAHNHSTISGLFAALAAAIAGLLLARLIKKALTSYTRRT